MIESYIYWKDLGIIMSNMSKYDLSSIEIEFAPNFDETPTTELQYSDLEHQQ